MVVGLSVGYNRDKMKSNKQLRKHIHHFAAYMASGGAQFWTGYAAFAVFDKGFGWSFWAAKIYAYLLGATVNFMLERSWVFKKKRSKRQEEAIATRFYGLMLLNFVIDLAIVAGLRELSVSPYIGQFLSAGFFTVWNYMLFNFWVFKKQKRLAVRASSK